MTQELTEAGSVPASLPVEQRAEAALVAQGAPVISELQKEVKGYADLKALVVTDKESDAAVHNGYMTLRGRRTEIQGMGKLAREDAVAYQKAVVAVEKELIEVIKPVEDQLKVNRDTYRDEQKRIREKAKARNGEIEAAINFYKNYPTGYFSASAAELEAAINELSANDDEHIKEHFSQWDTEKVQGQGVESAIEQRDLALASLTAAHEKTVAAESAALELQESRRLESISKTLIDGLSGTLPKVESCINRLTNNAKPDDLSDNVSAAIGEATNKLIARKNELEQKAKVEAGQSEQIRKTQEAEAARMKAETDAANAKARAAKEEADRLKQEKANRKAEEERQQREIKEEEARKAEEAANAARQEALRPDKEKLTLFLDQVEAFVTNNAPELEDENAVALRDYVLEQISKMNDAVKDEADKL